MSIADKLTTVTENVPKVYFAGHSVGETVGEHIGYDKGVEETETEINEHLSEPIATINQYLENPQDPTSVHGRISYLDDNIPNVYMAGFEDGKSSGTEDDYLNTFWDLFQQQDGKERTNYRYAFYDNYPDDIFKPKYPFKCKGNCSNMFQYAKMTKIEQTIDFSESTMSSIGSVFANTTSLETISDLRIKSGLNMLNWFTHATALKNITITGIIDLDANFQYSPLSADSIRNIVGCLSPDASGKTLTLNKAAVNAAFVIDVDDEASYPVGSEYYNLRHSRDNWNFNYI